jgi:hypothetical protein
MEEPPSLMFSYNWLLLLTAQVLAVCALFKAVNELRQNHKPKHRYWIALRFAATAFFASVLLVIASSLRMNSFRNILFTFIAAGVTTFVTLILHIAVSEAIERDI